MKEMKLVYLDKQEYSYGICYLCRVNLLDYVRSIGESYRDYEIQRGIVKNVYLDKIAETIEKSDHIPLITLVDDEDSKVSIRGQSVYLKSWQILDGLQRTHRLKVLWDTHNLYLKLGPQEAVSKRELKDSLSEISSNVEFYNVIQEWDSKGLSVEDLYAQVNLWIEVWSGLTLEEQIRKMLMLNAGHKPVNNKHQLEILFAHVLPALKGDLQSKKAKIYRERERSATMYSKNRVVHEYFFSHLISGAFSLISGQPVNTNAAFIRDLQSDEEGDEVSVEQIEPKLIKKIITFLMKLDEVLDSTYEEVGVRWLGREVAITGLFAAIGSSAEKSKISSLQQFIEKAEKYPSNLNLSGYEDARASLDISKINVGSVQKRAIQSGIENFIANPSSKINWKKYFEAKS